MSAIGTALYKFLTDTFGALSWQMGSVIRELVAEPIVGLSDTAAGVINNEYAKMNIAGLLADPENNATAINALFDELGLSEPTPTASSGSVRILTSSDKDVQLISGSTFYYQNTGLYTTQTYRLTTLPETSTDLQLTQVGETTYTAVIPVQTLATGAAIGQGAQLTWSGIDGNIYEATVEATISGGVGGYTAAQKINIIRQRMFPTSLTCAESILRLLNNLAPNSAVDCSFARVSTGGRTGVYVKTTQTPRAWSATYTAVNTANTTTMKLSLPSTGVFKVKSINNISNLQITKKPRVWEITYQDPAKNTSPVVALYGLPILVELQEAIDKFLDGTGFIIDLRVPVLLEASMYIPVKASDVTSNVLNGIVNSINATLLGTVRVGDSIIRPLLTDAGITAAAAGTYTLTRMDTSEVSTGLATADTTPFRLTEPFAVYTYINNVSWING